MFLFLTQLFFLSDANNTEPTNTNHVPSLAVVIVTCSISIIIIICTVLPLCIWEQSDDKMFDINPPVNNQIDTPLNTQQQEQQQVKIQ